MKKALISTIEPRQHFDGSKGLRVAQVENESDIFPVAEDMYWLDCDDNVIADLWYFDTDKQVILAVPQNTKKLTQPATNGLASV